jgi:prolyl-tRNA editing enzyme YbaK/EbsC (Cys-tRNA(Pro) deacylase)
MSKEKALQTLQAFGLAGKSIFFATSTATVQLAAEALSVTPGQIAKTMAFYGDKEGKSLLILLAGDINVNSGKFKRRFGFKPKMVKSEDLESYTGHMAGGVCPFGNPEGTKVYLDISLKKYTMVYPAVGTDNSAIPLSLDELGKASGSLGWVDIGKEPTAVL